MSVDDDTATDRGTASWLRAGADCSTVGTVVRALTCLTAGLWVQLPAAMTPEMIGAIELGTRRRPNGFGRFCCLVVNSDALADWTVTDKTAAEANWAYTDEVTAVEGRAGGTRSQEGGQLATRTDRAAGVVGRENGRITGGAARTVFATAQSRTSSTGARHGAEVCRHAIIVSCRSTACH